MKSLKNYIVTLLGSGKNFFSKHDAIKELGLSQSQFKYQAYRLTQKKAIKRLASDFYMIIPAEYKNLGGLPPLSFIDPLMKYLGIEYYVGLLSAAALYGTTQQQPMAFQVIIEKRIRDIKLKRGLVEFHTFSDCKSADKSFLMVPTGYIQVSSKEQTMLDLIRFYKIAGYLANVASVIKELAAQCDLTKLTKIVGHEKTPVLQRLGYVLECTGFSKLAEIIYEELQRRTFKYVLLRPDFHKRKGTRVEAWKLIINDTLEIE